MLGSFGIRLLSKSAATVIESVVASPMVILPPKVKSPVTSKLALIVTLLLNCELAPTVRLLSTTKSLFKVTAGITVIALESSESIILVNKSLANVLPNIVASLLIVASLIIALRFTLISLNVDCALRTFKLFSMFTSLLKVVVLTIVIAVLSSP